MSTIFFDPGFLSFDQVKELKKTYPNLRLIRHRDKDIAAYEEQGINLLSYPKCGAFPISTKTEYDSAKVWQAVINDHQTFLLLDRADFEETRTPAEIQNLIQLCFIYQVWLERERPQYIIFTVTPHNILTWTLARVAEEIKIPVLYFQQSIFPWRQFLLQGLKQKPEIILIKNSPKTTGDDTSLENFIKIKKADVSVATPLYEKERLQKNKGKFFSYKSEFKNFFRHPRAVMNKFRCFKQYQKLANSSFKSTDYAVFFLHFQPERTSVPEGYGFGVQTAAIMALLQALPDGVSLVVKEHPSTFTNKCSMKFRYPAFYKDLVSLDSRLFLAPMTTSSYDLIDGSIAVASITGTISGEALIRSKPAVVFGSGPLQAVDHPAFYRFSDKESLSEFLLAAKNRELPRFSVRDYFDHLCDTTSSGLESDSAIFREVSVLETDQRSVSRQLMHIFT